MRVGSIFSHFRLVRLACGPLTRHPIGMTRTNLSSCQPREACHLAAQSGRPTPVARRGRCVVESAASCTGRAKKLHTDLTSRPIFDFFGNSQRPNRLVFKPRELFFPDRDHQSIQLVAHKKIRRKFTTKFPTKLTPKIYRDGALVAPAHSVLITRSVTATLERTVCAARAAMPPAMDRCGTARSCPIGRLGWAAVWSTLGQALFARPTSHDDGDGGSPWNRKSERASDPASLAMSRQRPQSPQSHTCHSTTPHGDFSTTWSTGPSSDA